MIKKVFFTLLFILSIGHCLSLSAQGSYSLYVGDRQLVTCPSPPGNAAISQTAWGSSGAHLKVEQSSKFSCYVTVTEYFTGTEQVRCDYYYYWYDRYGHMFTKHATTYYNFTCRAVTITPSQTSMTLNVGEGKYLEYTYSPSNVYPKPVIRMQSQNSTIATVNYDGYVRGVEPGTTSIVLINNAGPNVTCQVVVRSVNPTSVSLPSSLQAYVGESTSLTPTVYPSNAQTKFTWYSKDNSIAQVSSNGSVTGIKEGSTQVYAVSANGLRTNDCHVNVNYRTPTSVSLNTTSYSLPITHTYTLKASVAPSNARYNLTWSVNRDDVVSITQDGVVTALKEGTAVVTVQTDNGRSAKCTITVPPNPSSISIPSKIALTWGKKRKLKYTFSPSNAYYKLSWSSNNTSVVQVDQNGQLTARGAGTADVKVRTQNGKEAVCRVEVDVPVFVFKAWMRSQDAVTIGLEEHPKVSYADGKLLLETRSRRIEMDTAQVHKMTLENQTVDRMPQQILMDSELELPIKTTKQLVATLLPKDYDIETQLRWKSQSPDVVSVSSTGLVKAVAPGEAEVSVTASNGCSAICHVSVPEPSYHLFLWLKDGRYDSYQFSDKPQITYSDGKLVVNTKVGEYSYVQEQVHKITLSDSSTPIVSGIASNSVISSKSQMSRPSADEIRMQGMLPGEKVYVYNVNGILSKVFTASAQGNISITLLQFAPGIYILKSKTTTYKIIKK